MSSSGSVVIVGAARTPIGAFLGELKEATAPELGACAIAGALIRSKIPAERIDEVCMGCVLTAGLGQAPARQAALEAGLPDSTGCVTVNKMCGSGMKAIMLAHDALSAGSAGAIVAGGMESMSNAPYLLARARAGYRMGHGKILDHMFLDGLEDAYEKGRLMGSFAEDCARAYQFTRREQDEYAIASLMRAQQAATEGAFDSQIVPMRIAGRKETRTIDVDETPRKANLEEIPRLKPAFAPDGSITAANASSISDGAAALVLTTEAAARSGGLIPLATVVGHATHAAAPRDFPTAPIGAIEKLLSRIGWTRDEVDLFEINEAFAVVVMAAMHDLGLSHAKVNVHGGACALGHPIGASGARIVVTLLYALERYGLRRGVAALCIGGGEATALAIERVS
ncbi:acetyl-CoA C-acyltransferase [Methylocystis bryophila]|uniref:Beta-ketothiolase n=1 Tax=Methylocystis bryophila TaxID=655015 RepID=A0A1W6MXV1_9HYPH|nr:acetyl-CoA C-acyltransferase [Methylocystis bryophila]ARN82404.1 acetyl-CoA acetyltransferase [Methylocystis bryophila]BDV38579.1 acetyl-CoA acetyltransferase [Methylocystis bryophila]